MDERFDGDPSFFAGEMPCGFTGSLLGGSGFVVGGRQSGGRRRWQVHGIFEKEPESAIEREVYGRSFRDMIVEGDVFKGSSVISQIEDSLEKYCRNPRVLISKLKKAP